MPLIGLLHLLIGISFAYHAHQTGRPQFWIFILLFMPMVGPLAYVLIELVPELIASRSARKVKSGLGDLVNPDREWRQRYDAALDTDTVETKRALAEECERRGMWAEAVKLYEIAAQGVFADDEALLFGLARARLEAGDAKGAQETLDALRTAHPNITHQEAHLLYARTLEAQDKLTDAISEYEALIGYYAGLEARVRFALLLLRFGEASRSKLLLEEVVRTGSARRHLLLPADRDWLKVARANL